MAMRRRSVCPACGRASATVMGACTECGFHKDGSPPSRLPGKPGWGSDFLDLFDLQIGLGPWFVGGLVVSVVGIVLGVLFGS